MAIPDYSDCEEPVWDRLSTHVPFHLLAPRFTAEETREFSEAVFQNFVAERIQNEPSLQGTQVLLNPTSAAASGDTHAQLDAATSTDETDFGFDDLFEICRPSGYRKNKYKQIGEDLKQIADSFAQSRERCEVRRKADKTKFEELNKENFCLLLSELFSDHRNIRERIVILFFFCSDLLIRALKEKVFRFAKKIFNWSLSFFRETVSVWVQKHGGWGNVVYNYVPRLIYVCSAVAIGIAAVIYIKKNWHS